MVGNLSSPFQEIPPRCTPYDYDDPGPPFSPATIAAVESIKEFLSTAELARARRLETVYYSPVFKDGVGIFIPGLRSYPTSLSLYIGRYNADNYMRMLESFLDKVYCRVPEKDLGGVHCPWFRVTTPDGRRNYPLKLNGNLKAWRDTITEVAKNLGTTLAWFDRGKFCCTEGRRFAFGDLTIDRAEGGKPMPQAW